MIRKIIEIDQEKCNGCGLCADACHEGAIGMVDGKARLLRDDYCDGLGDCLPACPAGAIRFVEREAAAYNEAAVQENKRQKEEKMQADNGDAAAAEPMACGCPGTMAKAIRRDGGAQPASRPQTAGAGSAPVSSQLSQWPVQIRLVLVKAPYLQDAHLLVAADCTAYAYGNFHQDFIRGRVTLVGCPKLDPVDYKEKLLEILRQNEIKSLTIVRMEVPCCGGLERAAVEALRESGRFIPWQVVTISTDGRIL